MITNFFARYSALLRLTVEGALTIAHLLYCENLAAHVIAGHSCFCYDGKPVPFFPGSVRPARYADHSILVDGVWQSLHSVDHARLTLCSR